MLCEGSLTAVMVNGHHGDDVVMPGSWATARVSPHWSHTSAMSRPPVFSMDEVDCTGAEESLQQCGYNNHDDCDKEEAAGGWRQLNPSARIFKSSIREILRG